MATIRYSAGAVAFEAPIYELPPADARQDLAPRGGSGTVAFGALLFVGSSTGAGAGAPVLANAAFNGKATSSSSSFRTSAWLVHLDGEPGPPTCGAGCDWADPGILSRLDQGFSLVLKIEEVDPQNRRRPVSLSQVPVDVGLAVAGESGGGSWCQEVENRQDWAEASRLPVTDWSRCVTTAEVLACDRLQRTATCQRYVERFEAATSCRPAPSSACGPVAGPAPTSSPFATAHRLASGSLLAAPVSTRSWFLDLVSGVWLPTGGLTFPRSADAASVLLPSGQLLVTGGSSDDGASRSAELLDPATGGWTLTGSMAAPRSGHTATVLSSGQVLVIGGRSGLSPAGTWSAELYDPAERSWATFDLQVSGPPLAGHTALALPGPGAPVLVVSGSGPEAFLCSPATGCRPTAPMGAPHPEGTFTLLDSGKVLALGGRYGDRCGAELFDPALETWTTRDPMPQGRADHAAVVLPGGDVLVAGGAAQVGGVEAWLSTADRYDPAQDRWSAGGGLGTARTAFTLLPEPGGSVLVLGGRDAAGDAAPAERLCPPAAGPASPPTAASRARRSPP
ncbi:MAG: hypothetical protein IPO09_09570 [Anaeromyxobacter sp.]|nr:hypothetical protein [Anaeromyxobacter sp.]MBL0278638.1 hypothetical protein [Anaeromyxobacter sp.]